MCAIKRYIRFLTSGIRHRSPDQPATLCHPFDIQDYGGSTIQREDEFQHNRSREGIVTFSAAQHGTIPGVEDSRDIDSPVNGPPVGVFDKMDDLDNDCLTVTETATRNARLLSDILSTLMIFQPLTREIQPEVLRDTKPRPVYELA